MADQALQHLDRTWSEIQRLRKKNLLWMRLFGFSLGVNAVLFGWGLFFIWMAR